MRFPFASPEDRSVIIAVGTDDGDLVLLDHYGHRINTASFDSSITDLCILSREGISRVDIAVSTEDGRVIICDDTLQVRASQSLGGSAIGRIITKGYADNEYTFFVTTEKSITELRYYQYYLRKSRHY